LAVHFLCSDCLKVGPTVHLPYEPDSLLTLIPLSHPISAKLLSVAEEDLTLSQEIWIRRLISVG